jgi:hypothetical protein
VPLKYLDIFKEETRYFNGKVIQIAPKAYLGLDLDDSKGLIETNL